jgi:tyrosine-protein phosphatase non-receptor type 9
MVWEQHCLLIVMTTRVMERGRVKCGQYWEPIEGCMGEHGNYSVKTLAIDANEDYTVASLELKNLKVIFLLIYFMIDWLINSMIIS